MLLLLLSIGLLSFAPPAFSQPASGGPPSGKYFDHVVIVVLENQGTREALADTNIASIAKRGAWLVVTWDEGGEDDSHHNQVLTILLGDVVSPGRYDERLTHYSLLRTIEDNFGPERLADGDRNASAMPSGVWRD